VFRLWHSRRSAIRGRKAKLAVLRRRHNRWAQRLSVINSTVARFPNKCPLRLRQP
jgi:hypothetical protein